MAKRGDSYTEIKSDDKYMDVIECIVMTNSAQTGTEIARAVGQDFNTAMCHIKMGVRRKWIAQVGDKYEPGNRLLGIYAARLRALKDERDSLDRKIAALEA